MRIINIFLLIVLFGCASDDGIPIEKIKWDFYKKNTKKYFLEGRDTIYFYKSQIEIANIDLQEVNKYCFHGNFRYLSLTSRNSTRDNSMIPTVDILCYDKNRELSRYYIMSNAYIDVDSQKKEQKEDQKLIDLIKTQKVTDFLENYKIK